MTYETHINPMCILCIITGGGLCDACKNKDLCGSGICVVEFNASFNSQNSVPWIENLNDCETARVDIATAPDLQKKHKIVVVPTIVVFNEGEEQERFQANIMMTMDATIEEVQEAVDDIMLNDF